MTPELVVVKLSSIGYAMLVVLPVGISLYRPWRQTALAKRPWQKIFGRNFCQVRYYLLKFQGGRLVSVCVCTFAVEDAEQQDCQEEMEKEDCQEEMEKEHNKSS